MAKKKTDTKKLETQTPLLLRAHRLMEVFAKSDEERDFYLDRTEGFLVFVNLDKTEEELEKLQQELQNSQERYCLVPKLSYFETKKLMENFVNEKVYDVDTKEKLLDIIGSKEARENFLEFIYDQPVELEKWQQYYQEKSRIRIIEWLRKNHFHFVFEEDLDLATGILEKVKATLFDKKVPKEVDAARKLIATKAKSYYSSEALNPRPKRGRPPKQTVKNEVEPQVTSDIYLTVPTAVRPFLFTPEISSAADVTFSAKFESKEELIANIRQEDDRSKGELEQIAKRLASLRAMTQEWRKQTAKEESAPKPPSPKKAATEKKATPAKKKAAAKKKAPPKKTPPKRAKPKTK